MCIACVLEGFFQGILIKQVFPGDTKNTLAFVETYVSDGETDPCSGFCFMPDGESQAQVEGTFHDGLQIQGLRGKLVPLFFFGMKLQSSFFWTVGF